MNRLKHIVYKLFRLTLKPFVGTGWADNEIIGFLYQGLLRLLIPQQSKTVMVNDCKMLLRVGGAYGIGGVAQHIIYMGDYEPQTTKVFKAVLKKGMGVVDVGANIGYYTLLAARLVGEQGRVWAYEPEVRNYNELSHNIALNGFSNVEPMRVAVGDVDGVALLNVSRYDSGVHSLLVTRDSKGSRVAVTEKRLDTLLKGQRVDLVKVDTEGYDYHVLRGAKKLIAQNNGISIIVEYWPKVEYSRKLWALLGELGLKHIYLIDEWAKQIYKGGEAECVNYAKRHGYGINLICSKEEALWIGEINGA